MDYIVVHPLWFIGYSCPSEWSDDVLVYTATLKSVKVQG